MWFGTRCPWGQAGTLKTDFFCQISQGFWERGSCHTFLGTGGRSKKNVGSVKGPKPKKTGPEGNAGQKGDLNFGITTFVIKGTTSKIRRW